MPWGGCLFSDLKPRGSFRRMFFARTQRSWLLETLSSQSNVQAEARIRKTLLSPSLTHISTHKYHHTTPPYTHIYCHWLHVPFILSQFILYSVVALRIVYRLNINFYSFSSFDRLGKSSKVAVLSIARFTGFRTCNKLFLLKRLSLRWLWWASFM